MGIGPPTLALYRQLKILGAFDGIDSVIELGSQGVWCTDPRSISDLFKAFGRPSPSVPEVDTYVNNTGTGIVSSRRLHESLGFQYDCVDIDGNFGSIALDLNFDQVPPELRGKYGLTSNHGTSEHILDQRNTFKAIHDFTAPGGLMLHALPFTVHLEHGFFNYQPNFFDALARYNSYETLGTWVGPDWSLSSLIPWEPRLLEFLTLNARTTHLLVVLQRKLHDAEFCIPVQRVYEPMLPAIATNRYQFVVNGKYHSDSRLKNEMEKREINLYEISMVDLARHLGRRLIRKLKLK
jgi:hypothetical protein